ncbi:ImmA/IrrE family metallo-endopeptidase [Pseudacidobacterium ailaaui]|jgi:hypothetical protein|uniref:ImmA/IrrE family metallo-endopeptidase n=1 Tax=Pseudacidobacterium ailaaui TaxID=1382359 RepID=UPI00047D6EE1|nr:ImmA/IrrE family metallo-endopeptidase [Pseudacidobacterium ailaaui]
MRTYRSKSGPFLEQPFYRPADFESICVEALRSVELFPTSPSPVRIDRFIEKRFKVQPTYASLPPGVLGFTRFGANGVEEIVISQALDEEGTATAERRLRTTLAHEGGHGLLHAHLFALGDRPDSLFSGELAPDAPKIMCRDDVQTGVSTGKKPPYRWWEFQANQAMGTLLLPQSLVEKALETIIEKRGLLGVPVLSTGRRKDAIRLIAETFNVNPIVAHYRLDALYPTSAEQQLTL